MSKEPWNICWPPTTRSEATDERLEAADPVAGGGVSPPQVGGAERTAHAFNRFLMTTRGVRVMVASSSLSSGFLEGVEVKNLFDPGGLRSLTGEAGVVCAQSDHIPLAARLASACKKPIIYFVHSTLAASCPDQSRSPAPQFVVYNAHWVRDQLAWPMRSVVARPPVDWRHYRVETNREHVTLINVDPDKGSDLFFECAR